SFCPVLCISAGVPSRAGAGFHSIDQRHRPRCVCRRAPDARVVLRNTQTGIERNTVTNAAGTFVFLNVPPGTYTLEMSKAGFNVEKIAPFTLEVNQTATFDGALTVGSVQQSVTVEAVAAGVEASTAELGAVVTRQVADLPLNGRNFTQLL